MASASASQRSTHLDLVQIREGVPHVEGAEAAVAPGLLLPGRGGPLRGDVVRYGGQLAGGGGGGGGGSSECNNR